ALLATLRHSHDVDEELAAFLEFRGEKFNVAKMSNVVDRFGCHGCRSFVSFDQFCRTARANASTRLLAGIGTMSASASPALSSSARKCAMSRTPHAGFSARKLASKTALLGAV